MTCLCHASLSFHVPSELSCRSKLKGPGSAQSKPKGSQVHLQLLVGFPLVLFKVHTACDVESSFAASASLSCCRHLALKPKGAEVFLS